MVYLYWNNDWHTYIMHYVHLDTNIKLEIKIQIFKVFIYFFSNHKWWKFQKIEQNLIKINWAKRRLSMRIYSKNIYQLFVRGFEFFFSYLFFFSLFIASILYLHVRCSQNYTIFAHFLRLRQFVSPKYKRIVWFIVICLRFFQEKRYLAHSLFVVIRHGIDIVFCSVNREAGENCFSCSMILLTWLSNLSS